MCEERSSIAPECDAREVAVSLLPMPGDVQPASVPREHLLAAPASWTQGPARLDLLRDELLHELFERQVDLHGRRTAVIDGGETLSYEQFDRRANQLAHHLRSLGVGPGARVALLLPRSKEVYVCMLAVLKAGAAYVPLDPEYPPDRIAFILADAGVHALISTSSLAQSQASGDWRVVLIDAHADEISRAPAERLTRIQTAAKPGDLCYVIYTSGSTGRPKGVQIEHRSAAHLVRAEAALFDVLPADRVYQGFSVAFDASVEEIWLALACGAALVIATSEIARSGPALSEFLANAGVTVLSCVPTLLAMMGTDVPTLRLLIVGGEACPHDLVYRWCRPGLRMVNTYGPTEATVIATAGELNPSRAVTIGRPIPNHRIYLLDDDRQPVPACNVGEIYIGGPGVARGYIGRSDLEEQAFVPDPFSLGIGSRLYRTGDLGRWTPDGEIEFRGRADSQVKLRGFRIELTEVESAMMRFPGVQAAAVTVFTNANGTQQLVGYLVPNNNAALIPAEIRRHLRSRLPAYMVPSLIDVIDEFPTLPSGKVDRGSLPRPVEREIEPQPTRAEKPNPDHAKLMAAWRRLFPSVPVQSRDDFFLDLGGHSLLAAQLVSDLRPDPDFDDLSVTDVYNHPTIDALTTELATRRARRATVLTPVSTRAQPPDADRRGLTVCGLAQLVGLYLLLGVASLQWLGPYLVYTAMADVGSSQFLSFACSLAVLLGLYPLMLFVPLAAKWILLGRMRPGSYPLWGGYYLRWWFVQQLMEMAPVDSLVGTPLLAMYLRGLGARIGSEVYLGTDNFAAFDVLSIGDGASIGYDASLLGYAVADGWLHIGSVRVGAGCYVGARSMVREDAVMEDESSLADLSMLPRGSVIPAGQSWVGSPARLLTPAPENETCAVPRKCSALKALVFALAHAACVFVLPIVSLLAIFPGLLVLHLADRAGGEIGAIIASPVAALFFVVSMCLLIALMKWTLMGRVRPGSHELRSGFYLRKWFVDQLMESSLELLGPLYATLYLTPWYRLLGVKLGTAAEISTACAVSPDLIQVDDESFIADAVCLGAPHIAGGMMTLAATRVGRRSFVGNSALVPAGSVVGDNALIGVLSTTPISRPDASERDTSWLGSPAIYLPQRQASSTFSPQRTFSPTAELRAQRLAIEFVRVTLPTTMVIVLATLLIDTTVAIRSHLSLLALVAVYPLMLAACGVAAAAFVIAAKWILMGRYRPGEQPLWSNFVWRTELLTALHEHLANPMLVELFTGTPFLCTFFRLLGCRIGERVYLETTSLTEFDLIDIGDDAALNRDCTIQTHLFEDRVMKMSTVRVGAGCSLGSASVVLYDSSMEPRSHLGDLSLLMKGETLPANTSWHGTPARRTDERLAIAPPPTVLEDNKPSVPFSALSVSVQPVPAAVGTLA